MKQYEGTPLTTIEDLLHRNQVLERANHDLETTNQSLSGEMHDLKTTNQKLLRTIQDFRETIDRLKEEINKLKKQKGRPNIGGSSLEGSKRSRDVSKKQTAKRSFGNIQAKEEELVIEPEHVPEGSRFKGYRTFFVYDAHVVTTKIAVRMKVYEAPDGKLIRGKLPKQYSFGHFGASLIAHCLYLYHGVKLRNVG